jgi:RecA-family ATPase
VQDWRPGRNATLLFGDGGTGKSLMALQLAVAVAAGRTWLGMHPKAGTAMFLTAEDERAELHRRTDDILRAEGLHYDDLAGLLLWSLAGEDALLAAEVRSPAGPLSQLLPTELFRLLDQRVADEAPELVVIDTLADVYPSSENDRGKVRQFITLLRGLALRRNCAVVLLAHPSLAGLSSGSGTSGSTAWSNSVRARLYLSRVTDSGYEADPDRRNLTTRKLNYGRSGGEIGLTWRDGVFWADATETGLDRSIVNAKAERVFVKLLALFSGQGRHVSASPSNAFAPTLFAAHPEAEGCTSRALKGATETLLSRGVLEVATHGTGAKMRRHIALKVAPNAPEK